MGVFGNGYFFVGLVYGMTKVGCRFIHLFKHLFMQSKITISFDYEQKTPFIKIHHKPSDDERDRMVAAFLHSIPGEVCFAKFQYEHNGENGEKVAGIRPIPFANLPEEVKTMQAWIDSLRYDKLPKQVLQSVSATSPAFREFLEREGIYFETDDANGATLISGNVNLFNLGFNWGEYHANHKVHTD